MKKQIPGLLLSGIFGSVIWLAADIDDADASQLDKMLEDAGGRSHQRGIADYASKTISITSACLKSNYFYAMFV